MIIFSCQFFKDNPGAVEQAVRDAVDAGYRHFDCAYIYCNEKEIGKALRDKIAEGVIKREDLFITTKVIFCLMTKFLAIIFATDC